MVQLSGRLRRWWSLERQAAQADAKRRIQERALQRAAKRQRDERWRWLNRPDITMQELLRGSAG